MEELNQTMKHNLQLCHAHNNYIIWFKLKSDLTPCAMKVTQNSGPCFLYMQNDLHETSLVLVLRSN